MHDDNRQELPGRVQAFTEPPPAGAYEPDWDEIRAGLELPELPELAATADEAHVLALANTYLGVLAGLEREIEANNAELSATIALLRERHDERQRQLGERVIFCHRTLRQVFEAYPPQGKAKSRKLLGGTIGTRTVPARLDVQDEDALLAFVLERGDMEPAVKVVPETRGLDRRGLAAMLKDATIDLTPERGVIWQGAEIPGLAMTEPREEFYVRPAPRTPA